MPKKKSEDVKSKEAEMPIIESNTTSQVLDGKYTQDKPGSETVALGEGEITQNGRGSTAIAMNGGKALQKGANSTGTVEEGGEIKQDGDESWLTVEKGGKGIQTGEASSAYVNKGASLKQTGDLNSVEMEGGEVTQSGEQNFAKMSAGKLKQGDKGNNSVEVTGDKLKKNGDKETTAVDINQGDGNKDVAVVDVSKIKPSTEISVNGGKGKDDTLYFSGVNPSYEKLDSGAIRIETEKGNKIDATGYEKFVHFDPSKPMSEEMATALSQAGVDVDKFGKAAIAKGSTAEALKNGASTDGQNIDGQPKSAPIATNGVQQSGVEGHSGP